MATSAEQDDHDDKDPATDGDEKSEKDTKAETAEAKKPSAVKETADDDHEDEDEEVEAKPAPKPAAKSASSSKGAAKRPAAKGARGRASAPAQGSSLGKSMILFVVIIGGLAAGFAILGREEQVAPAKPKWTAGQTVDVEITLVKNDRNDLACAAGDEIGGKHCAFEAMNKPWTKGDVNDDKKLLKPYTTTDRIQFAAAGVWSEPALAADKLPASRFSLKCKFKVEGTLKNLSVRWESTGQWFPNNEWFAGAVSDCKVVP